MIWLWIIISSNSLTLQGYRILKRMKTQAQTKQFDERNVWTLLIATTVSETIIHISRMVEISAHGRVFRAEFANSLQIRVPGKHTQMWFHCIQQSTCSKQRTFTEALFQESRLRLTISTIMTGRGVPYYSNLTWRLKLPRCLHTIVLPSWQSCSSIKSYSFC